VGLGSDFDGAVKTPFDTTGLPVLFDALLKQGFGEEDLAKIAGGNALRVLREALL
jgi:microsomal dipeptidase-like Zn-dependent dipeptidase